MRELHTVLTTTPLESPVLWILGSDEARSRSAERLAARGDTSPEVEHELGVRALAQRRYRQAAEHFARAARGERPTREDLLYAYALWLDGDDEAARGAAATNGLAESPDLGALWREILEWPAPVSGARDRPSS
jgi:hypothetical protein